LGFAQLAAGEVDAAATMLEPLADVNPLAGVGFAQALQRQGNQARALEVLRQAETSAPTGVAGLRLRQLLDELGAAPAPPLRHDEVRTLLAEFDRSVLRFAERAHELLEFEVELDRTTVEFAHPVFALVRITNKGVYPISLGAEAMVDPTVAVSIQDTARSGAGYQGYLTIPLYGALVLAPGAQLEARPGLDVGLAEFILCRQPQRRFNVEF
jgi:hypothetical protein